MQVFDQKRAILLESPDPLPFTIRHYLPLKSAIEQGSIHPLDHCLIAPLDDTVIVLPTLAMVYHHVAQGELNHHHWMISFCCLCNSGSIFNAQMNDQVYHFGAQGFYDVMVLLADEETQSFWNHLTGTCLYGELAGTTLNRLNSLIQMRAADALIAYPDAQFGVMDALTGDTLATAERWNAIYRLPEQPQYSTGLLQTGKTSDTRLQPYDMGLGLWTLQTRRYYSILSLYEEDNMIVDTVDGRVVVVTLDPDVGFPIAFYADTDNVKKEYDDIIINGTRRYHKGIMTENGQPIRIERPNHNAIRWYAFSTLFPGCEIYRKR